MSWGQTPRIDVTIRMLDESYLVYNTAMKEKYIRHELTLPEYYELRQLLSTTQPRMGEVVAMLKKTCTENSLELATRSLVLAGSNNVRLPMSCSVM